MLTITILLMFEVITVVSAMISSVELLSFGDLHQVCSKVVRRCFAVVQITHWWPLCVSISCHSCMKIFSQSKDILVPHLHSGHVFEFLLTVQMT